MAFFLNNTPVLRIALENPHLGAKYPRKGVVIAVLDIGYEGFVALPEEIYVAARLNELTQESGNLIQADGSTIAS